MKFIKTFCLILLLCTVVGYTAQASTRICKNKVVAEQGPIHDKKPKGKERKKVAITISKGAEYVIVTIVEILIEVCVNAADCSSSHNYNHR